MTHPIEHLYCREQTYRNPEAAYRSFYKWVCKNELFGRLEIAGYWKERPFYERRTAKYTFGHDFRRGYPNFNASRSEARRQWGNIFLAHKRRILSDQREDEERKWEENYYGRNKLRSTTPRVRHFFRALNDLSKINHVKKAR